MKNPHVLLIPAFFLICLNLCGQEIKECRGERKIDETIPTMKGYSGEGYYQYLLCVHPVMEVTGSLLPPYVHVL